MLISGNTRHPYYDSGSHAAVEVGRVLFNLSYDATQLWAWDTNVSEFEWTVIAIIPME